VIIQNQNPNNYPWSQARWIDDRQQASQGQPPRPPRGRRTELIVALGVLGVFGVVFVAMFSAISAESGRASGGETAPAGPTVLIGSGSATERDGAGANTGTRRSEKFTVTGGFEIRWSWRSYLSGRFPRGRPAPSS
jgi:hypothetical protein